jgi:hypothetical protein
MAPLKQSPIVALLLATVSMTAPSALAAQDVAAAPVVVELYTSQGCSSCPPADALLTQLADRDDVIALALHVEYWDYIGWNDIFANPEHSARQRAYARASGERMIYTPQLIVQGMQSLAGHDAEALEDIIEARRTQLQDIPVSMTVGHSEGGVEISLSGSGPLPEQMQVQLVEFIPQQDVNITKGENRGKTIQYSNIVTHLETVAQWSGLEPLDVEIDLETQGPIAVLLQDVSGGPVGPILTARRLD